MRNPRDARSAAPLDAAPQGIGVHDVERLHLQVLVAEKVGGEQVEVHAGGVPVHGRGPARGRGCRAARVDEADARLGQEVALDATHGELFGRPAAGRPRADLQEAEVVRPRLAGQPRAVLDRDDLPFVEADAPAEVRIHGVERRELEDARVLQEEVALLGIEEREAGQVDAPPVHLRFREVGVHGHGRAQAGADAVVDVDAGVERASAPARPPPRARPPRRTAPPPGRVPASRRARR